MIRVLSVEDDPLVQAYLTARLAIEPDIQVVGQVSTAAAACAFLRQSETDIVLLDYQLGGANGMQLLQTISLWFEELPAGHRRPLVLFCTGCADPEFERDARALGAEGVVAKDCVVVELVPAVRAVAEGRGWFDHGAGQSASIDKPRSQNVLIAAHDRLVRAQLSQAVLAIGCLGCHAWRSEEVLTRLELEPVDLLLLDDRLPGRILTTTLLEQIGRRWPDLPVLFLAALPAGMEHYSPGPNVRALLKKPLSVERLRDEITLVLALNLQGVPEGQVSPC